LHDQAAIQTGTGGPHRKTDDLNYYSDDEHEPPDAVVAKSVLVQTAPGVFHEIYYSAISQIDAVLPPSRLLAVGTNWILEADYLDGGNARSVGREFFHVGEDGTKLMDSMQMRIAAEKAVPDDSWCYGPAEAINFRDRTWSVGTEPKKMTLGAKVSCCTGKVTVSFKIENGDFVVTGAVYKADRP
jgi:hypothetical protein